MATIARALISVSDKTGVVELARGLASLGAEILSTGGTAKVLREASVSVIDVAAYTGSPEILDGRVKTLHPKIHGGLLGRRSVPSHMAQMQEHRISPIDIVVVNLYPFESTIAKPGCSFEEAVEQIDIGGPSMLRSAAKNHEDVLVVVDPGDYRRVLDAVTSGTVNPALRRELAMKVFQHTARYDGVVAAYLEKQQPASEALFPASLSLQFDRVETLRYGENPHQQAAFYREPHSLEPSVSRGTILHGKAMSYNNYLDANSALELAKEFADPAVAIIKHNNPCGVASGTTPVEAYVKARATDPVSAFGGVLAFNRRVDLPAAREITSTFVEVVIAPGFEPDALTELKRKKDLRLLDVGPLTSTVPPEGYDLKKLVGGLIIQQRDLGRLHDLKALRVPTARQPTEDEYAACAFAWIVCKHVNSNAIVYAVPGQTVGIGAGQMSRVDSVKLAGMKAVLPVKGAVMASDAFFPFRDGLDTAAQAGITAVIQPGGSIRDQEVIKAADEHGMAMILTGMRHFRH
jgi:phosphoribosylaminoimidazolecarboxamide formyltransferase/IMP cyclohydrolase